MSSNRTYFCRFCKKNIERFISEQYGKLPQEKYENLRRADTVAEILPWLPKDFVKGETDRLDGCDLDYEFFEDWGEGVEIDENGNLKIDISGSCDLCGTEFQYIIIVPPNRGEPRQKVIDLTKRGDEQ